MAGAEEDEGGDGAGGLLPEAAWEVRRGAGSVRGGAAGVPEPAGQVRGRCGDCHGGALEARGDAGDGGRRAAGRVAVRR
ncbi:hypothetical protein WMF26_33075 [Sorangium sp. So ce185]